VTQPRVAAAPCLESPADRVEQPRLVQRWFVERGAREEARAHVRIPADVVASPHLILEETGPLKMSYYTYQHLRALFLLAGLEPVEEYGSFAREPLDNTSQEMIFVLRKIEQRKPRA